MWLHRTASGEVSSPVHRATPAIPNLQILSPTIRRQRKRKRERKTGLLIPPPLPPTETHGVLERAYYQGPGYAEDVDSHALLPPPPAILVEIMKSAHAHTKHLPTAFYSMV